MLRQINFGRVGWNLEHGKVSHTTLYRQLVHMQERIERSDASNDFRVSNFPVRSAAARLSERCELAVTPSDTQNTLEFNQWFNRLELKKNRHDDDPRH